MFENVFNNIDDVLHRDQGCSNELDYVEQSSWIIFLKYLDDLEEERGAAATLSDKTYKPLLEPEYRWREWAAPKKPDGTIDHAVALTGDDLLVFVNDKLFPCLAGFRASANNPLTLEYKIGEIFTEVRNKIQSGYNLSDVLDLADSLRFMSTDEKHELSHLYEAKIQRMGNAGRNGGEYYTPRPLFRSIVEVVNPQIGETVYDGAADARVVFVNFQKHLYKPAAEYEVSAT
jgi:type I restriction enzyme M protein